jgi:hypothetical protein
MLIVGSSAKVQQQTPDQVLNKKEGKQQGHGRKINTAELQWQHSPNTLQNRIGGIVEKSHNRIVRIGPNPGDNCPGNDDKDIDLQEHQNHFTEHNQKIIENSHDALSFPNKIDVLANTYRMAKQRFRPARLGVFSGVKAYIKHVEVLKKTP